MKLRRLAITLLVLAFLAGAAYWFLRLQFAPYGKGGNIYLPKGTSVGESAELLFKNGILRNTWCFKVLARWEGLQAKLKPGEYQFDPEISCREVLEKIARGERVIHRLTIPEGYNFAQIAALIEKAGIAPQGEATKFFRDPALLAKLKFPAISLEGYLYPATYEYDRGTTAEFLLLQMLQKFNQIYLGALEEKAKALAWSIPQVVTLASIIEKETGLATERPLISSVFHNRLRLGMPLQTDLMVVRNF